VQIVRGADHLLHGDLPEYPERAMAQRIEGDVVVDLDVDDRGEVADARVLSGPEALRRAALESVLRWHYSPSAMASTTTQAVLRFHVPPEALTKAEFAAREFVLKAEGPTEVELRKRRELEEEHFRAIGWATADPKRTERQIVELKAALADRDISPSAKEEFELKLAEAEKILAKIRAGDPAEVLPEKMLRFIELESKPIFDSGLRLAAVRAERVPEATAMEILAGAGVAVGDVITEDTAKRISKVARAMDEHFGVKLQRTEKDGGVTLFVGAK
jgi:TonB family protein